MFTGIIENQGVVIEKEKRGGQVRFGFKFVRKDRKPKVGDSIAVSGTCLTVVRGETAGFEVDVVRETLEATTLGNLKRGDLVNLEKSLKAGDPLGGHFVTGHIDGRGKVIEIKRLKKNTTLFVQAPKDIIALQVPKGSIALDGVSLTVQKVHGSVFEIAVIPHTLKVTTLGLKRPGSEVNIEIDIVARYLKAFFPGKRISGWSSKNILKMILRKGF